MHRSFLAAAAALALFPTAAGAARPEYLPAPAKAAPGQGHKADRGVKRVAAAPRPVPPAGVGVKAIAAPEADPVAPTVPEVTPVTDRDLGKACAGVSKKRVKGVRRTAFSACVTALAKLAGGSAATPKAACKGLSKKKVKGLKGTPFSQCVKAAAKLKKRLDVVTPEPPVIIDPVEPPVVIDPVDPVDPSPGVEDGQAPPAEDDAPAVL